MRLTFLFLIASALLAQPTLPNAVPMPGPEIQYLNFNGQPLAGAYLCSFAAGTTTPLATYTDSTAVTPNTNPIVLDSYGRASVWIGPQLYKFVLYSGGNGACPGTGSVQWSQDNVTDTALYWANYIATLGSSCSVSYTGSLSGMVSQTVCAKLRQVQNIKDWGAVCDGSTSDQSAFVTALAAFPNSGGTLNIPEGACIVDGGLVVPRGVTVHGEAWGSHIKCLLNSHTFCMAHAGSGAVIQAGGFDSIYIDGPAVNPFSTSNPTAGGTSGTIGLYLGGDPSSTITPSASIDSYANYTGLVVRGFDRGLQLGNNAFSLNFYSPEINYNNTGFYLPAGTTASVSPNGGHLDFHGGSFSHNIVAGIDQSLVGSEIILEGTGLYYNQNLTSYTGLAIEGAAVNVYSSDSHYEQCFGPIVQPSGMAAAGQFKASGGQMVLQGASSTNALCPSATPSFPTNYAMVMFATAGPTYLNLRDVSVFSGHALPYIYFDGGDAEFDGTALILDGINTNQQTGSSLITKLFNLGTDSANYSYVHVSHQLDTGATTNGESMYDNYTTRMLNLDVPVDGGGVNPLMQVFDDGSLRYKWSMQATPSGGGSGGGPQFAYVQSGQLTAFTNNPGDAIIVTSTSFVGPFVTDTQGNTYNLIMSNGAVSMFAATHVVGGSDTITLHSSGCSNNFECQAHYVEYSALSSSYGVFPGACSNTGAVTGGSYSTPAGAMAIIGMSYLGATTSFTVASGVIRITTNALISTLSTADQSLSSVSGYTNTITFAGGTGISGNCSLFLGSTNNSGTDALTLAAYDDVGTLIGNVFQVSRQGTGGLNLGHVGGISTVTGAVGVGAGTSPTWALTGSDMVGQFAITTGSSPTASSTIVTITFGTPYTSPGADCVVSPVNFDAAHVVTWITGPSTNSVQFQGTLAGATQYTWNYFCGQAP